jgi:hypothetical protein
MGRHSVSVYQWICGPVVNPLPCNTPLRSATTHDASTLELRSVSKSHASSFGNGVGW